MWRRFVAKPAGCFSQRSLMHSTQRYYRRFSPRQSLATPVSLGFLGWLFGSTDYSAVRKDIADIMDDYDWDDGSWGPVLVRLAWHASGTYCAADKTGGSNGATMRFKPESADDANAGLSLARARLEAIKEKHPNLSYADLWVLASYVAIEEMGGPEIEFKGGRSDAKDGSDAKVRCGRLPDAAQGADHVRDVFYRMGFSDQEIVVLVGGGHAIGRCHTDRSGFDGPWTRAPTTISNEYFNRLFEEEWVEKKWKGPRQFEDKATGKLMMLPTDMVNLTDPEFRKYSQMYQKDEGKFIEDFAAAFKKLTELGC